jgi:hypothetical protein
MTVVFSLTLNGTECSKSTAEWQKSKSRNEYFSSSCSVFAELIFIKRGIIPEKLSSFG